MSDTTSVGLKTIIPPPQPKLSPLLKPEDVLGTCDPEFLALTPDDVPVLGWMYNTNLKEATYPAHLEC